MQLLKTKLGVDSMKSLDVTTASYLEAYHHGTKFPEPNFASMLHSLEWDLQEVDSLWQPGTQPAGDWICKLAFALLIRTKTVHLKVCYRVVQTHHYPNKSVASKLLLSSLW